ncbi:DUF4383 domain-containing protein [Actinokineospora sp. 24-640]
MPEVRETRVARLTCAAVGLALLVIGIVGFAQSGLGGWGNTPAGTVEGTAGGLGGSTLLNVVHMILGALALFAALRNGVRLAALFGILAFTGLLAYDIVALIANDAGDPLGPRWPALLVHGIALAVSLLLTRLARQSSQDFSAQPDQGR